MKNHIQTFEKFSVVFLIACLAFCFGVNFGVNTGVAKYKENFLDAYSHTYSATPIEEPDHGVDLPTAWLLDDTTLDPINGKDLYYLFAEDICHRFYSDVDPDVLMAIASVESKFNPNSDNGAGCIGLTQIMPYYHKTRMERLGVIDLKDPYGNLLVCADFLHDLYSQYKDPKLVLMLYNMRWDAAFQMYNAGQVSSYAQEVLALAENYRAARYSTGVS